MFRHQKGVLPFMTQIVAVILMLFVFLLIPVSIADTAANKDTNHTVSQYLIDIVITLIFAFPLLYIAGFLFCLFPEIRIVSEGNKVSVWVI